jgi:hypothetical protein
MNNCISARQNSWHGVLILCRRLLPGCRILLYNIEIKNLIPLKNIYDTDPGRQKEQPLFRSVLLKGQVQNAYAREKGTRI